MTGQTSSAGGAGPAKAFPTTAGAYQGTHGGGTDAFVAILKADGSGLEYSTFLGGAFDDSGSGIAVQGGKAYVAGSTNSPGFPTTPGAFQRICGTVATPCTGSYPVQNAFAAEIDPAASGTASLAYSTFLGGSGGDGGSGVAVDPTGAAYVTGDTSSTDFPVTPGAFQTALTGGGDTFVAKVTPDGSALSYATHLGGGNGASPRGISVDPACPSSCSAYVTGSTSSTDFPTTPGAFATSINGSSDGFVTGVAPDGSALTYSTYLAGGNGVGIAARLGTVYVTGYTSTPDFRAKDQADRAKGPVGDFDAFLSELDPGALGPASLVYATRLGGNGFEEGQGVAVDGSGSAYLGGTTQANRSDFPTTPGVLQPRIASINGSQDGFVAKVSPIDPALPYVSGVSPLSGSVSGGATVRISGRGFGPVTAVSFGGTPAASFTVDSSGQITAVSPAHAVGGAAVTVTTSAGTSTANPITLFSYGEGRFRGTADPSTLGIKPVVLKDGRVLLFSPGIFGGPPASAQLYDPRTEAWTDTAAPTRLASYRPDIRSLPYTATLLSNGKVLVTDGSSSTLADTAELYDPAGGGSWTDTVGPPSLKRAQASATRLDGPACRGSAPPSYCGKVLLAGGLDPSRSTVNFSSAELYDPTTDSFSSAGSMANTHRQHGAVLLDGAACHAASPPPYCGKVLVAGGFDVPANPLSSAELYDPATNSWSGAAPLNEFRARNNLVQLPDGRVLDPGGQDVAGGRVEDTELYDPVSDSWKVSQLYPGQYPTIPIVERPARARRRAGHVQGRSRRVRGQLRQGPGRRR